MAVFLTKGENISLTKGIQNVKVGLSWDTATDGEDVDLDVMAIELTDKAGKAVSDNHLVFYNSVVKTAEGLPTDPEHAVIHSGDNRTGDGDGDDEVISVNLSKLDPKVGAILFVVNIYQGKEKGQNFGQVRNPKARLYCDGSDTAELVYELDEDFSTEICVEFCMLYKHSGEWKFKAVGTANNNGLLEELQKYGIPATGNA